MPGLTTSTKSTSVRTVGATARGPTPARRPRWGSQEGSASLELVILFPVLLLLVTALVQYGLWFHARSIALAAAHEGLAAARAYTATADAGLTDAATFAAQVGNGTLTDVEITVTTPATGQVRVQVTGRALPVLPGTTGLPITQSAEGPRESFTTSGAP
ncbi:TadE/TadG family type IV pilus assembly protein [Cellulomonas endophytica]|uniref:TadE/TadG family type IV pilus assembly protein n=1 Tax=Cellulomonas endophytica TaxID=2494735 RepID=UPI0023EA708C|nr:TadE/TadG family type IV pilus assembly protein [Cellulomonas endophytica]